MKRKHRLPRIFALLGVLGVGCAAGEADPPHGHDPHEEMPEAMMPLVQTAEDGPVGEGAWDRDALGALEIADGFATTSKIDLGGPASRATVWLTLAETTDATPLVFVRAGWANGQTGPWTALAEIGSDGVERVLASDLDTAATSLTFRIADGSAIEWLRWSASVPLDPSLRQQMLSDVAPANGSGVAPRSAWSAAAARCGTDDVAPTTIVIRAEAEAANEIDAMRALQRRDRDGLGWCDVRPSYVVGATNTFMARGSRRAAVEPTAAANAGQIAIAVLGCAPSAATQARLNALLDELVVRHAFTSADGIRVASTAVCAQTSALEGAIDAWLATDPFDDMPPPPPPPPPTDGTIDGVVEDASMPGVPIDGAHVACACGASTTTDASGRFTLVVPAGSQTLAITKMGFEVAMTTVDVTAGDRVATTVALIPEMEPNPGVSLIDHAFLIDHFGGANADPFAYPETQEGFQDYLDAVGVTYFAAWEYVVPNNPSVATSCGYTILLPERGWWPRAAALGLLADRLRALVNEPVTLRNWWRPPCYNEGVGGAPGGDHPDADALDLDFRSATSRAAAQRYLCDTYWNQDIVPPEDIAPGSGLNPRLNLSVGLGGVTIHLGLLSSNGRRFWKYASYSNEPGSGNCW